MADARGEAGTGTPERLDNRRPDDATARGLFVQGFVGLLPLWAGAIPAGLAYGVAARAAGLGPVEAQLMSVVVFSAAAQVSAAALIGAGTSPLVLVGTVLALNAQLLLLSLTVGRRLRLSWPERLLTALLLTDGAYGIAAGRGPLRLPVLLGAGTSMFVGWNLGTVLGTVLGQAVPDPGRFGIDLVAPLTFLAVLVPLVRDRTTVTVAVVAGVAAFGLSRALPSGVAVLGAGVLGIAAGAWLTRHDDGEGMSVEKERDSAVGGAGRGGASGRDGPRGRTAPEPPAPEAAE